MSNLRTRILALLLAVSMLAGYALPAAAEEYQPGTEITGEVEPTPAPEETATEPPTEAPTQAPTEPATEAPTQEITEATAEETEPVETDPVETDPVETELEETESEETEPEEEEEEAPYPEAVPYFAAPAEESLVYGMNVVNPGTSDVCWDFPVSTATAVRCGGTLFVTLRVPTFSPYLYLYFGSQAALEERMSQGGAFPVAEGILNNGERVFHFTVGAADNSRITVCLVAPDATQESGYLLKEQELTIPSVPVADLALYTDDTAEAAVTSAFDVMEYPAAPADEQDVSGKLFVAKQGADEIYPMFKIETATAIKDENLIYVTVQVNKAASGAFTYSYLYFGTRTELVNLVDSGSEIKVAQGENGEETQSYHFTLPLSAAGTRVPVCILKGDLTAKSPYNSSELELVVPADIPEVEVKKDPVPTPVDYPAAPADEQDVSGKLFVAKQGADAVYPMFKIETATAIKDENQIYVTVHVNPAASGAFTYSYLYFGTRTALIAQLDAGGEFSVAAGVDGGATQSYHFTLPLSAAGTRVPVCILKGDLTAKSPYNSSELELVVPADIPEVEVKKDPVPTPVDYPAAPADEQDVSGKLFVAKQGADAVYPMFKIETATAIKDENQIYVTVHVNPAASGAFTYSYLYFGTRTALIAQLDAGGEFSVAAGVDGGATQSYHFTLPLSAAGTRVPVCILKGDLTAKSPYNSSELELVVPADIPEVEVKKDPVPTPVDYPAAPAAERDITGLTVVEKETGTAYADFSIASATGIKVDGQLYVTALVNANSEGSFSYSYLYFGTKAQLEEQLSEGGAFGVVAAVVNGQTQNYHFTLSAEQAGTRIPVCLLKADLTAENPYNAAELELVIPEIPEETAEAAPAIPTLPDTLSEAGIKVIKAEDGAEFKMFAAGKTGMVAAGDKLLIHFETTNTSFDALYFGSKEDGLKSPYIQGVQKDGVWVFEFELPASYRGTQNPICLRKTDGTWYSSKDLLISIPADSGDSATVNGNAGIQMYPVGQFSQTSFAVSSSSAMLLGDKIYVTITGKMAENGKYTDKVAGMLYLGSRYDKDKTPYITGTLNADGTTTFTFTVPADKQGTSICAVVGYTDGTWDPTNLDFFLNIPNFGRSFDPNYYADGVYDLYGNAYAYLDKADRRSLPFDVGSTLTVSGDQITIKWVTRGNDTDKLYFGLQTDDKATREAQSILAVDCTDNPDTPDYKVFYVTLSKSVLGSRIPFVRHSRLWWTDTDGWLESQDYVIFADYLTRTSDKPDDGTTIDDAGMKMLSGGSEVEQMFVITASSATLKGDTITCTITGKPAGRNSGTADKLYLGSRDDADKSNFIVGTLNDDETTTFVFDVPAEKQGTSVPVVVSFTGSGWDTTQDYFLNIPDFGTSFDLSYYTDGVYDLYGNSYAELSRTQNKAFPVDKGSTLSVSGDKIVIKWVCRSSSYDKVYFGSVSDDEATRNAGAAVLQDYAGEATWKYYSVTLPKSALSSRIPFARHSTKWYTTTNGWLTTQDYLVLANRLPKLSDTPDIPVDPTDPSEPGKEIEDGYYQVTTECDAAMFRIVDAKLKVVNGKMTAELTLSGTGYDYLYAGTGEEAKNDKENWAPFTVNADGKYVYTVPVSELDEQIVISSHSKKNDKWYDRKVKFLSNSLKAIGSTDPTDPTTPTNPTTPTEPTNPTEPGVSLADGIYNTTGKSVTNSFEILRTRLIVQNGKYKVALTIYGGDFDCFCAADAISAAAEKEPWVAPEISAVKNGNGDVVAYMYNCALEVDNPFSPFMVAFRNKGGSWQDSVVALDVNDFRRTSPDGNYRVSASCGDADFEIISAKLSTVYGQMTAELTLNGTDYDHLYAGTSAQAINNPNNWAPFKEWVSGQYTFKIGVSALDTPVRISAHNAKTGLWSEHLVVFLSDTLSRIDGSDPTTPTSPTDPTDPTESDSNGTTSAVDSSTKVKDGTYKPDGFTFSGGSGRVSIVCDKVIIKNGKSYAVIRFVSKSSGATSKDYKYVKASNDVFYPAGDGSFTIPVQLNANNRILGMTTKMTAAHEIEYTIFVQLKKAASASGGGSSAATKEEEKDDPNSKLDKEAPDILGLNFKEVIKTPGARYLKLFQYDQGIVLAEVDLRRDTVLDTDAAIKELAQADKDAAQNETASASTDEPVDDAQITADYIAKLYQQDILKYLLVPANVELPAGLEKQYLIVRLPASNVYLMDEDIGDTLDALDVLSSVTILGSDDNESEAVQMLLESGEAVYGGDWRKPDYRTLIVSKVGLGLIGTDLLPLSEETLKERKESIPQREALTAVEYRDRMAKLTERFAVLGVPVLVDRSADEPTAKGQAAWLKLYGLLYGKETQANKLYDAAVAKEEKA